jgi:hypothetical protein
MPDFLEEKRREINSRLNELRPLIEEFTRLEAAMLALAGIIASPAEPSAASTPRRRSPGRPRGSANRKAPSPNTSKAAGEQSGVAVAGVKALAHAQPRRYP